MVSLKEQCQGSRKTSATLLHSGMDEIWLANSMECFWYPSPLTPLSPPSPQRSRPLTERENSVSKAFGEPFCGPTIPFGSMVEYHPVSAKDQAKTPPVWQKGPSWHLRWLCIVRGDHVEGRHFVADAQELQNIDASELCARRLNAKEVLVPRKREEYFTFTCAYGTVRLTGECQEL